MVMEEEGTYEAKGVAFALVVTLRQENVRHPSVSARLDGDGHEEAVAGAVAVGEGSTDGGGEDVV